MKKSIFLCSILVLFSDFFLSAEERPVISDLNVSAGKGNTIYLAWSVPEETTPEIKNLLVYKSNKPVVSWYDISGVEPAATLEKNEISWADKVTDFRDYYYAVIAVTERGIYDVVIPSVNSTVNGVHIKIPRKEEGTDNSASAKETVLTGDSIREMPLPYLDLLESQSRKKLKMSDNSRLQAKILGKQGTGRKINKLEPHIFEEDLVTPDGGDDYLLFDVLRTSFIQKRYKDSIKDLERLSATKITESVSYRTDFYLGEAYYYTGNYQEAVKTFLKVYDVYPTLTKQWIDSSLDLLTVPEE